MAAKVDSMSEKNKKQARAPPLPAVRGVILCTLLHAGIVAVSYAFSIASALIITSIIQPPSWLLSRLSEVPDDKVDMAGAFAAGMLCCGVSLAAAEALARMLPRLRHRLHLLKAYATIVATVAGYSMWARLNHMFVAADPDDLCFSTGLTTVLVVIFILGVVVLGLILRRGDEEEEGKAEV